MHQQIRTKLGKASSVQDGGGAMARVPVEVDPLEVPREALVKLLDLVAERGYNLNLAAGENIEFGGEFIFALEDHDQTAECAQMLKDEGYRDVRILESHLCEVTHTPGALRDCLRELSAQGRRIDEIYVGVRRDDGIVPVQVTTILEVS